MKRWMKAVLGGAVLCLLVSVLCFAGSSAGIRDRVVRLHVLAHDDSDAEQALKLQVRDAVSAEAARLVGDADGREEVLARLREGLPAIQAAAQAQVTQAGYDHAVRAELTEMYFTTRTYEEGTHCVSPLARGQDATGGVWYTRRCAYRRQWRRLLPTRC